MKFNQNDPNIFIYLDLIGRELYAKNKTQPNWTEFKFIGTVCNETKNSLFLKSHGEIKQYIKDHFIFRCNLSQPEGIIKVLEFDGTKILGRPEQRIKKIKKINRRKLH